jgi:hypothetical protein
MNEAKVKELISEMVRLLITYEIELTTYQTVYEAVSKKAAEAGFDVDLNRLLRHVAGSSSLQAEAEAEYAAFFGIHHGITQETLDGALASIKQTIDHRNNRSGQGCLPHGRTDAAD